MRAGKGFFLHAQERALGIVFLFKVSLCAQLLSHV